MIGSLYFGVTALFVVALSACTPEQTQQAAVYGQLFCSVETAAGPVVKAVADASGAPVLAVNQTKAVVDAACGAFGGVPVPPPVAAAK